MSDAPRPIPFSALQLKVPPLALVALSGAAMWGLPSAAPRFATGAWPLWCSVVVALLATAVCLAGVLAFRQARTTVDPRRPDAAQALVVRGIYRYTRNPMYLGFLMLLMAWALYLVKPSALLVPPLFVLYLNRFQIRPEEEALRQRFGSAFDAYAAQVRRWL